MGSPSIESNVPSRPQLAAPGRGTHVLFVVSAACIAGFGIHAAEAALLPILFGVLFATAAQPLVNLLERLRFPGPLAIAGGLVGMLLLFVLASGTLVLGILDLATDLPRYQRALAGLQGDLVRFFSREGLGQVALFVQSQRIANFINTDVEWIVGVSTRLIAFTTLAGLVAFFALLERESLVRRFTGGQRGESWTRILADTQRYLGIKTVTSALTGVLATVVCLAAGVPNAPLWGAIAFWLNYVPVVGSFLAGLPPVVIALASQSHQAALGIVFGYLFINFLVGNYLEPRWHGAAAGLSPLGVVLSIAAWGSLLGPLGALLAVPLTMGIKIGCFHTRDLSWVARLLGDSVPFSKKGKPSKTSQELVLQGERASIFS